MTEERDRARQMLLAGHTRRRVGQALAPASKDFTGRKAVDAATARLSDRYDQILSEYEISGLKVLKRA